MKEKLTEKITNFALLFTAFASIPFNVVTYFALSESEYQFIRWLPFLLAVSVIILAIFRKKIALKIKVQFYSLLVFLAAIFCLLLGLLDTASLWFVIVIIFALFTGNKNEAFYLFIFAFLSILIIGILMIMKNPYIPFNYGFEDCQVACVTIRIIDFLILGFLIYYIIKIFLNTIDAYIDEISQKATILEKLNLALESEMNERILNKKLSKNLNQKNKELAINTLQLLRQSEMDNSLIVTLKKIANASNEITKKKLKKLIHQIRINNNTIIWEEFEKQFIEVNTSFYKKLHVEFPNLTKNDKKICAFIKLNMNTKDMASLLHISTRGVETARYRLRKTMQLKYDKNLSKYLQTL